MNHELSEKSLFQKLISELSAGDRSFQFIENGFYLLHKPGVQTDQAEAAVICFLEAGIQFGCLKIVSDPQNKPFIRKRKVNFRHMNSPPAYKDNIPGLQMIGFSFYMIGDFSGEKNNDFMKIMIMVKIFFFSLVFNMKSTGNPLLNYPVFLSGQVWNNCFPALSPGKREGYPDGMKRFSYISAPSVIYSQFIADEE